MVIKGRGREKTQGTESKQQWISKFLTEYKTNDRESREHSKLWLDRERLESCCGSSRCGLDENRSFFLRKLIVLCYVSPNMGIVESKSYSKPRQLPPTSSGLMGRGRMANVCIHRTYFSKIMQRDVLTVIIFCLDIFTKKYCPRVCISWTQFLFYRLKQFGFNKRLAGSHL